ncbi:MAG: HNH endonuclease [Malacoplasma sp.]|nr:HNH endonuclease [Malacoplasma sp.]
MYDEKTLMIYKQFIQIESANFRPTDIDMLKTDYYKKRKNNLTIRYKILEPYQELQGFFINKVSKNAKKRIPIPNNLIDEINKELIKLHKVKSSIDIFTGSNSSGAELNHKASNIVTFYEDDESRSFYNFSNPLNRKEIFKSDKNIKINSVDEIELIEFSKYLELNPKANELYCYYNSLEMILNNFYSPISNLDGYQNFNGKNKEITDKHFKLIDEEKKFYKNTKDLSRSDFIYERVKQSIKEYTENLNDDSTNKDRENKLINKLRNAQRLLVKEEIRDLIKNNPDFPENYFFNCLNDSFINYECAHIIPVNESRTSNKRLEEIADNNNCLLLSPNFHSQYDKNIINFDSNGICYIKGIKENKLNIKKEWLNEKRKKYLERAFISRSKNK